MIITGVVLIVSALYLLQKEKRQLPIISPLASNQKGIGPLAKYSFINLRKREFLGNQIELGRVLKNNSQFTSYMFYYNSQGRKVSGQANLPAGRQVYPKDGFPVIVMVRGYVDDQIYRTGMGTLKPSEYYASNGFITLAPDFLGFGESDDTYPDILEDRFVRPMTIFDLLASVKNLKGANPDRVGIWAHSNGGQIAISVLEISKKEYPTVLWAPVTKGFPESVITYMSQMDDLGLKVKKRIDDFLDKYDPKEYSISEFLGDIKAPLQVHQGTGDDYIEENWTGNFVSKLKSLGGPVNYYKYPGDNHNLSINWDTVVGRDLEFFKRNLNP